MWKRRWFHVLILALVFIGGAFYWLVMESDPLGEKPFSLDIAAIRHLANSMPGDKPSEIRVERIASFTFPAAAIMAGDSWTQQTLPANSYQLVFPDRTIVIDSAMSQEQANAMGTTSGFDDAAYERMSKGLRAASLILITHEHPDHLGGAAAIAPQVIAQLRLTRQQVDNLDRSDPVTFPKAALSGYQPLEYDRAMAVAPGVVVIRSPGHTPGSQIIFVRTANRNEVLFLGDVAWHIANVREVRERPRLLTMAMREDRSEVMGELAALHGLSLAEPQIAIVPGHDGQVIDDLVEQKVMIHGFK